METLCPRCKCNIQENIKYCPICGAHPETGLTVTEAEEIWINLTNTIQKKTANRQLCHKIHKQQYHIENLRLHHNI